MYWVYGTGVAWFFTGVIALVLGYGSWLFTKGWGPIGQSKNPQFWFFTIFGVVGGIAQYITLRRHVSAWWILASIVGWAAGGALLGQMEKRGELSGAIFMVIPGVTSGIAQSLVLSRHILQRFWWIIASGLGWGISGAIGIGTGVTSAMRGGTVTLGLIGVFAGVMTGTALVWLLRHPLPRSASDQWLTQPPPVDAPKILKDLGLGLGGFGVTYVASILAASWVLRPLISSVPLPVWVTASLVGLVSGFAGGVFSGLRAGRGLLAGAVFAGVATLVSFGAISTTAGAAIGGMLGGMMPTRFTDSLRRFLAGIWGLLTE